MCSVYGSLKLRTIWGLNLGTPLQDTLKEGLGLVGRRQVLSFPGMWYVWPLYVWGSSYPQLVEWK